MRDGTGPELGELARWRVFVQIERPQISLTREERVEQKQWPGGGAVDKERVTGIIDQLNRSLSIGNRIESKRRLPNLALV